MKKLMLSIGAGVFLLFSCNSENKEERPETTSEGQSNYEVASEKFTELNQEALNHFESLDFEAWGEMLTDDVQYFFPDGDAGTRTTLVGKEQVLDWWKNWKENSGIEKMTFTNPVYIPVEANQELNYSGLTGVLVLSYFSNEMVYNGQPVSVRMHFAAHFTEDSLIDRYYTYYDRTPILNTTEANVLEIIVPKKKEEPVSAN